MANDGHVTATATVGTLLRSDLLDGRFHLLEVGRKRAQVGSAAPRRRAATTDVPPAHRHDGLAGRLQLVETATDAPKPAVASDRVGGKDAPHRGPAE